MSTPDDDDLEAETAAPEGGRRLVIVESPAKAKTISGYLGRDYQVESSIGHIRDLPGSASEMPPEKKELWKTFAIDVDNDFEPVYVVNRDKKQQVTRLKKALSTASELLLATDEDREGEAIAWHLVEVLKPKVPVHRMVFHEITPAAIREAIEHPRDIDRQLVDAQETRRILDRLFGYELSPVLWKKVMPKLSAGRVQSVATRLIVERERERIAFRAAEYWDILGTFETQRATDSNEPRSFDARLVTLDGRRLATGRDFDSVGQLKTPDLARLDEAAARGLAERLMGRQFAVRSVDQKPYRRSPYAPFRTTTLQQEASRKLGYGAERTMRTAQRLYEGGYITYMRTDSIQLSETAITAARMQARELFGPDYVPDTPRHYTSKVKNAQEAHEAIRPSGETFRTPGEVAGELHRDELRLYELVWQRTVASQMADARGQSVSVRLGATTEQNEDAEFSATGKVITFPGFLRVYVEDADDPDDDREDKERRLPQVAEGDALTPTAIDPEGHSTKPPPRYTEATLVKELEEREIGRPSTYASIIGTILDRGYVFKRGTALVPAFLAFAVVGLLEKHFPQFVDYDFTARMEDDLDRIAAGNAEMAPWLHRFYFGANGAAGLRSLVSDHLDEIDAREINTFPVGNDIVLRVGRYGPYVERGEDRASVPEELPPDELTVEKAEELLDAPSGDRPLGIDPVTGYEIVARNGRYGPYVSEVLPDGGKEKPRTSSLFKTMSVETLTLDDALRLLTLPRVVGTVDGEDITALNGRYGPYVKKGSESRSLESEEQLFTLALDEALAVLAQPRTRGRGRAAAAPLRELGPDPATGQPMVLREGRFGPYVTDGETNASLRKGEDPAGITVERAAELLAERRAKGPAPKRAKKATAKKAAAKKTSAKKKTASKRSTAPKR
ncbi:MAG: topoisomerase [Frankiales bacterium]|nr:topoisomerase [Frankiales bacterium]